MNKDTQTPTGTGTTPAKTDDAPPNTANPAGQGSKNPKNPMTPEAASRIQSKEARQGIPPKEGHAARAQSNAAKNAAKDVAKK